jgi:alginate O-acetyltransferase complex protein AlgJ
VTGAPRQARGDGAHVRGNISDIVAIAVFLVMLVGPGVLALAGFARPDTAFIEGSEQRRAFVAPGVSSGALATGGYERDLERQIADAFPLRTWLVEAYAYPKFAWLGGSMTPNVVRGRDGWLFYGAEESQYVTGAWKPSQSELAHVAGVYAARARWCRAHGVAYVFLIAPNKSTIYPGDAPSWYRPAAPTPLDRLLPMLRDAGVTAIDVRTQLRDAAQRGDVYSHGDTHWNDAGAYIAHRAVVAALGGAGVRDAVAPTGTRVVLKRGDLLNFSGVGSRIMDRVVVIDFPKRAHTVAVLALAGEASAQGFSLQASGVDAPLLVAVIFGDSFANRIVPFLAEDFRLMVALQEGTVVTPQFDPAIVLAAHANVVVQELAERNLVFGASFHADVPSP